MAAQPLAPGGFALHPRDHPVDQRGPLELGKDAEHLNHHPAGRGPGVEGLGRRAEVDSDLVQLLQQLSQTSDRAREAVHPVDEEHVVAVKACVSQRPSQSRPLERGAGHLVAVAAAELPALLAPDVGVQARLLGFQRVGLVLLVSRDPGVGGNAHGHDLDTPSPSGCCLRGHRSVA